MPFSKLKIILERITINTWTEIVCYGNLYSNVDMFVTKTSQKGLEVAKGDQVADMCNGQQA